MLRYRLNWTCRFKYCNEARTEVDYRVFVMLLLSVDINNFVRILHHLFFYHHHVYNCYYVSLIGLRQPFEKIACAQYMRHLLIDRFLLSLINLRRKNRRRRRKVLSQLKHPSSLLLAAIGSS
mmetsp:Transcript_13357/g.21826  ORF Transcript_13357/g.21826 Transcript_13357/m.21826 type:complete len:122 (+) Transcript_13357:379-744(+)